MDNYLVLVMYSIHNNYYMMTCPMLYSDIFARKTWGLPYTVCMFNLIKCLH